MQLFYGSSSNLDIGPVALSVQRWLPVTHDCTTTIMGNLRQVAVEGKTNGSAPKIKSRAVNENIVMEQCSFVTN